MAVADRDGAGPRFLLYCAPLGAIRLHWRTVDKHHPHAIDGAEIPLFKEL